MKRFRVILELEALDDVTAEMVHKAFNTPWVTKLTITEESPTAGAPVAFIYASSKPDSLCHAVIKKKDGPWSVNRVGFCGCEPEGGPVGCLDRPDGGLCRTCAEYVIEVDGHWVVRADAPLPKPPRPYIPPSSWEDD